MCDAFLGGFFLGGGIVLGFFTYSEVFSLVDGAKTFLIDSTACTSSGNKLGFIIRFILLPHRDECL